MNKIFFETLNFLTEKDEEYKPITFPQEEINDLKKQLQQRGFIYTTRIDKEYHKYHKNEIYITPWEKLIQVTDIIDETSGDIKKHPFLKELTPDQKKQINGHPYEVLKLRLANKSKVNLYHYLFNPAKVNLILKSGYLLPINKTQDPERLKDYASRTKSGDPEVYFKEVYDKHYKHLLKKDYWGNYGIYTTPLDLFEITDLKYRFKIDYENIKKVPIIIAVGAKRRLVQVKEDISDVMKDYKDKEKIKYIFDHSSLKFKRLPQTIIFADRIKIDKKDLEIYE